MVKFEDQPTNFNRHTKAQILTTYIDSKQNFFKNTYVTNQRYFNVDRQVQMSRVVSNAINGDDQTPTNDFGDNYGTVYRDSSDGERTMGYSGSI